ncbi:MAG: hypothetical protein MJY52_04770 [Bacteroidaceae bacterium]|nr:hypothetical protein [Bacteroidaceae bacterium]
MNFREALQPQSVNKFTLDVCTPSRLLKQSHEFCTQRAEAHLIGATQRDSSLRREILKLRQLGTQEIRKLENQITGEIKSLRSKQGLRLCSPRRNSEGL